ncbi:Protein kinase-like domain protein [Metarhizium rileyi]|uniref:Protein kinase-like domain protein n=1 Tax=Metarhizium rileyi (strain RCEF 4871) TaxID=1649241 RepID=A0A166VXP7_METRR|nr:Protein kinase-like domain protein [Metarhizium rileyi RCEF 4871]
MQRCACEAPVVNEEDIEPFENYAVEGPATDIIRALCKKAETNSSAASLGLSRILFRSNSLSVVPSLLEVVPSDTSEDTQKQRLEPSPTKRVAVEPNVINPDRRCLRRDAKGNRAIIFVVEYKAAHKLQSNHVRRGLNEHLFRNVVRKKMSTKSSADSTQAQEDKFDRILAMILTQTFDFMIRMGLEYSYITAGKLFLFLHVKADNPRTLYYHFMDPEEELKDDNGKLSVSRTAVAQVVGFSLLALRSEPRSQSWTAKAQEALCEWPIPYPETEQETDAQNKRKHASSSGIGSSSFEETSNGRERSRQYCTMGCLMSLQRGQKLDLDCPNVSSHRIAAGSTMHPIAIESLAGLVQEQLAYSLDHDCEPLEMEGKYGMTGTLFKLSLTRYGYTFVGKGTIREFVPLLAREAKVYSRLARLQGEAVPVCLGSIDLTKPYNLTARYAVRFAGAKIVHMLFMSWVGEPVDSTRHAEVTRSLRLINGEGVVHCDLRDANMLWNEERGRVMVIDFESAELVAPPEPKQVRRLAKRKKRRLS